MMDVGRHPNITLLTYSEVEEVSGYVGNFVVRVRKKARSVDEDLCTGCGSCEEKCPRRIVDEAGFDVGMGKRKAIYRPFAQAVPAIPVIDRENCTFFTKGKCKLCEKVCPTGAINYDQQDEILEIEVGNIIVATGYDPFDAKRITAYGYGRYPNVFTSMEIERMLSGSGPTDGKIVLRDGETEPESIAIIHCVGSRDENFNAYCSKVCCMYSLKQAHLVHSKTNARMYQCFMDMRTGGKAYEEFYKRLQSEGVTFINGRPGEIQREGDKLVVHVEDRALGRRMRVPVDMVILSVGLEPRHDAKEVAKLFSINADADGWFKEKHPKLDPVATMTGGVFIAGCCQGPRDIPDSVAQGSAAAARVLTFIRREMIEGEAATAIVDEMMCVACTQCVQTCPYSAIEMVEVRGGQVARVNEALCQGCGTCAGACPSKAITLRHFTDHQLVSEMVGAMNVMWELEELEPVAE
jgi:heterodisulfide reductase subunit A